MQTKEELKRERILKGNLWRVIFSIALPLVLYNFINYLYGVYDLIIVSKRGIGSVDSVAILDQIKGMISTFGGAVAVGGSIIIARKVGSGDLENARKSSNTLFFFSLIVGLAVILIFIPFGIPFLEILNTPKEIIDSSIGYFYVQMISVAVVIINNVFIGVEKSRGNTQRLFLLNIIVVIIKVSLTTIFAYLVPNVTQTYIALATLIAQSILMIFGLVILFLPSNILAISFKYFSLKKELLWPIISLSLPIFVGKFLFSFGKVFVNSQASVVYGTVAVGALALSNTISGSVTNIMNSFEDAASTITSQNLGNKNIKRTFELFKKVMIIAVVIGIVGNILLIAFAKPISTFIIPETTKDYLLKREMVIKINYFESFALSFLALETAAFGLLYGYGKTKITMTVSMLRLIAFRIPPLLFLMYIVKMDFVATGVAMGISNASSGILAFVCALYVIHNIKVAGRYRDIELNQEVLD